MSDFSIKRLLLLSVDERKARAVTFHPKATLITGENDTGKSALIKSIYHTFGAATELHPRWKAANVKCLAFFAVNGSDYRILRNHSTFTLFDGAGNRLEQYDSVTHGLGPRLAQLFSFGVKLTAKGSGESITPPPSYLFLPFYFDQDRSWVQSWNSFLQLQQMHDWKRDLIEYHAGVKPNQFYELKGELVAVQQACEKAHSEAAVLKQVRDQLTERYEEVTIAIDLDAFRSEITELLTNCGELQREADKIKVKLVELHNEKMALDSQVRIVKSSLQELNKDYRFAASHDDHINCPTCGHEYTNSFCEIFDIAVDEDRCEELLQKLEDELKIVGQKINTTNREYDSRELQAAHIRTILERRKEEVRLEDLIESESRRKLKTTIKEQISGVNAEIVRWESQLATLKEQLKALTDKERRKSIVDDFRGAMRRNLFALSVHTIDETQYRDLTSRIREQGSDLPRALLAYGFSFLGTMRKYSSSAFCPIVIDSPIQQEQDEGNHQRILEFIRDNQPQQSQLVVSVVDAKEVNFGGDIIALEEIRSVLKRTEFSAVQEEMEPYLRQSIQEAELGL